MEHKEDSFIDSLLTFTIPWFNERLIYCIAGEKLIKKAWQEQKYKLKDIHGIPSFKKLAQDLNFTMPTHITTDTIGFFKTTEQEDLAKASINSFMQHQRTFPNYIAQFILASIFYNIRSSFSLDTEDNQFLFGKQLLMNSVNPHIVHHSRRIQENLKDKFNTSKYPLILQSTNEFTPYLCNLTEWLKAKIIAPLTKTNKIMEKHEKKYTSIDVMKAAMETASVPMSTLKVSFLYSKYSF